MVAEKGSVLLGQTFQFIRSLFSIDEFLNLRVKICEILFILWWKEIQRLPSDNICVYIMSSICSKFPARKFRLAPH